MLVILEVTTGPIAGRKIEIPAGVTLRLGRTTKSDYAIGEDSYLSSLHFAVECDGAQCRIRDLGSSNGTFVNGDRITECVAKGGDSVAAGGSTFVVHVEASSRAAAPSRAPAPTAKTPTAKFPSARPPRLRTAALPRREPVPAWTGFSRAQSNLLQALYREGEPVFALLDAIRDSRIPAFLDASGEQYQRVDAANSASPFLVLVPPQSQLLDVLIKDGWNHGWGFYFTASIGFENALWHWRSFVTLRNANGQPVTFRFWDPRVMRAVVPAMTPSEATGFFGLISRFIVEGDQPELAVEFSLADRGVYQQALVLV
jgi:pSer/pThr/pTyr-binding forkhead associated (FHA) protein